MSSQNPAQRADPFAFDVSDFQPAAPKAKPPVEAVRAASEAQGFPSREAAPRDAAPRAAAPREKVTAAAPPKVAQRRHRTGRNKQLSLKVTDETSARFTRIALEENLVLGELLDRLLNAYEAARGRTESR